MEGDSVGNMGRLSLFHTIECQDRRVDGGVAVGFEGVHG